MEEKESKKEKSKLKESFSSRKDKSSGKALADLIRQINEMSQKAKAKSESTWNPEPPLAA